MANSSGSDAGFTMVATSSLKDSLAERGYALNHWRNSFSALPAGEADGLEKKALEKLIAEEDRRREKEQAEKAAEARAAEEKAAAEARAVAENAAAMYAHGSGCVKKAEYKEAISAFEAAVRLAPGNAQYREALEQARVKHRRRERNKRIAGVACILIGVFLAFAAISFFNSHDYAIGDDEGAVLFAIAAFGIILVLLGITKCGGIGSVEGIIGSPFLGGVAGLVLTVMVLNGSRVGVVVKILTGIIMIIFGAILGLITGIIAGIISMHWGVSLAAVAALAIGVVSYGPAKIFSVLSPAAVEAAAEAASPQAASATVTSDALNLRAEPSGDAALVKTLKKGDGLTVTGDAADGWVPVEHDGAKGYVSEKYISIDGGE
jgi:hypothetical protein